MKSILILASLFFSSVAFSCPNLQGKYNNCRSELGEIDGEYTIDQNQESNYQVYNVLYVNNQNGDSQTQVFKTNNKLESRKEELPSSGVTVRIDSKAHCEGDTVAAVADVFFLGGKVGSFTTSIHLEGSLLKSNVDGSYLGTDVHKRIECQLSK